MFVVGEDQKRPDKGRTKSETAFKYLNNCVLLVQLATFLTVATLCTIAAGKTFEDTNFWFGGQQLKLAETIDAKTINCTGNVSVAYGGWNAYDQVISRDDFLYRLAYFTGQMRFTLICNGIALGIGAFNKVLMEMNIMEFRYKSLIIRKEIVTTVEIMILCLCIFLQSQVELDASVLRDYWKDCGLTAETALPFQPPLIALYLGLIWTLIVHVLSWIMLGYHTCTKPPTVPTTRDRFLNKLDAEVKQHAQEVEQTMPYPEDRNFQSAVDYADQPIPSTPAMANQLGPVGAMPHAHVHFDQAGDEQQKY